MQYITNERWRHWASVETVRVIGQLHFAVAHACKRSSRLNNWYWFFSFLFFCCCFVFYSICFIQNASLLDFNYNNKLAGETCSMQHRSYFIRSFFFSLSNTFGDDLANGDGKTSENSRCSAMRMRQRKWNMLWVQCTPMQSSIDRLPCRRLTQTIYIYMLRITRQRWHSTLTATIANPSEDESNIVLHKCIEYKIEAAKADEKTEVIWRGAVYAEQRLHRRKMKTSQDVNDAHHFFIRFLFASHSNRWYISSS